MRCLLLQRSTLFQCHLPTGTARYRSMSTSVNYSPEINFTNSFFVSNYSICIGFVFSTVYSYLLFLPLIRKNGGFGIFYYTSFVLPEVLSDLSLFQDTILSAISVSVLGLNNFISRCRLSFILTRSFSPNFDMFSDLDFHVQSR